MRHRADTTRNDAIAGNAGIPRGIGEGLSGDRIFRVGDGRVRKIAAALGSRGHERLNGLSFPVVAQPLIRTEYKELVRQNGSARRAAELILLERGDAGGKEISSIECVVTHELPECAVKFVGPCL